MYGEIWLILAADYLPFPMGEYNSYFPFMKFVWTEWEGVDYVLS